MRAQQKVVMAFVGAVAAWTPLASFIALHGTGLWRNYAWPSKAWAWWLWLPYAGSNHAVTRGSVAAALVLRAFSCPCRSSHYCVTPRTAQDQRSGPNLFVAGARIITVTQTGYRCVSSRRLFPGPDPMHGGIVVGEAYRVDQDTVSRVDFDPRDQRTWGQGGKAPLLIDSCDDGPTHSLIFAGSGGFKTVSAVSTCCTGQAQPLCWTRPARWVRCCGMRARQWANG